LIAFAIALWSLLWVTAPEGGASALKSSFPTLPLVEQVRASFLKLIGFEPSDSLALVAGLSIGERSLLSEQTADQMRELSLTHLVAVSGANLAIVIGAVWFLAAWLGLSRNTRFALGLSVMACYVLLVGPESSVIRAATMATFVTVGLWLGRGSSPLHSLALAVAVLLLLDPGIATDFGFALSAIATAGLLVAAGPIFEILKPKLSEWLALGVASAFAAQLFTTPILLMLQPGIPLYAVLANLLVEPVIAPVTILGITAAALALPAPFLSTIAIQLASYATSWIVTVASSLSDLPFARVHFVAGPTGVVIAAGLAVLTAALFATSSLKAKRFITMSIGAIALIGVVLSVLDVARSQHTHRSWDVLNCDVGQGDALLVRSTSKVMLIDVGPDPILISSCLKSAGVSRIDLLIISHYDADHVAGIDGLAGVEIGLALLPGFADDRPLAEKVQASMRLNAVEVAIGQRGTEGALGSCSWQILEPSFSATEASDSNDASLISLVSCPQFRLLALGDLGEVGQRRLLASSQAELRGTEPMIVKVAHHGSADQSRELYETLRPRFSLLSVGKNRFGHPTDRALRILNSIGSRVLRTDTDGALALSATPKGLTYATGGKLAK
jgi:competence protein ComEC